MPYLNILIYGDPGAGKTWLSATAQDHEATAPILFVDVEGGTTTIRHRPDVDVVQARTMSVIEDVHNQLRKNPDYYKTVVIDSLTELQKLDMRSVMKEQYDKRPDTTDIYVPSQREWGKSGERIRMIVRAYRDLPCNTIVTSLLHTEKDDKTGVVRIFPSLPGKLRSEIPGFFDIVGMLRVTTLTEENEIKFQRILQVAGTERVTAKDRTSSLDGLLNDPTIPMIWDLIN